jgi:hypothetical protein
MWGWVSFQSPIPGQLCIGTNTLEAGRTPFVIASLRRRMDVPVDFRGDAMARFDVTGESLASEPWARPNCG